MTGVYNYLFCLCDLHTEEKIALLCLSAVFWE